MVQCPKCGFSQPKDQYCAQCGVDMLAFKRPETPFLQKFLKSNFFHIILVGLVIFGVSTLISKRDKGDNPSRLNYFRGQLQLSSDSSKKNPNAQNSLTNPSDKDQSSGVSVTGNNESTLSNENSQVADSNSIEGSESESAKSFAGDGSGTAGSMGQNPNSKPLGDNEVPGQRQIQITSNKDGQQFSFKISYYEMNNRFLELMMEDSKNTGQFNTYDGYEVGALYRFHKRIASSPSQAPLLHSESKKVAVGQSSEWFIGLKSNLPENNIGFYQYLDAQWIDRNQARINFQVTKSWREPTAASSGNPASVGGSPGSGGVSVTGPGGGSSFTVQKASYPMTIEIPKDGAFFIAGLLNNSPGSKNPYQNEDYIASIAPFGILKSNRFRRGETQLVIVVELEKN